MRTHITPAQLRDIDALGIRRMTTDSRAVRRGDTFVAYPGEARDGRDFIPQALAAGAASVIWESEGFRWKRSWQVRNLGVRELKPRAGEIAAHIYKHPSDRLWLVGITGTNGKTSCSHWIAESLSRAGRKCAVIGTLGSGLPSRLTPVINTTPDAIEIQSLLDRFARNRIKAVSMEVSSHGLAQHRVAGVGFDVALLTNLTRDHLDYHGTMRRYRAAKARLFRWPGLKYSVLNTDDAFGAELAGRRATGTTRVLTYGFGSLSVAMRRSVSGVVAGRNLRIRAEGIAFDAHTPWGRTQVESPLLGRFNAYNLLGSLAALVASGVAPDAAAASLGRVRAVPGRLQCFGGKETPLVVVDYAHTPDALEKVLTTLRELMRRRTGRLICVFGCGGDRDRGKRPQMGRASTQLADHTIVTSDNPRSEAPEAIIADILDGAVGDHAVIADRAQAITAGIAMAGRGDVVLVAGKGHEDYQEIRGRRYKFSDAAVVRKALRRHPS